MNTDQCRENQRKRSEEERAKRQKDSARTAFSSFFGPRKPAVPATVASPPLVSTSQSKTSGAPKAGTSHETHQPVQVPQSSPSIPAIPCQHAATLLAQFRSRIEALPEDIPIASDDHPLAQFSGDPTGSVPEGEEAWEIWNGPLDTVLQKSPGELQNLVVRGKFGLEGLCNLLEYLARYHMIGGGLLEGKIGRLMNAMNEVSPLSPSFPPPVPIASTSPLDLPIQADPDSDIEVIGPPTTSALVPTTSQAAPVKLSCPGIHVQLPEGQSVHSAYPFGLHDVLGDPWDYSVTRGRLVLHASACKKKVKKGSGPCSACINLRDRDPNLAGIIQRFETGVHENSRLVFNGVGSLINIVRRKTGEVRALRLRKLNDATKLAGKAVAIDHLKQWVMAVGSGKVERVDRLVRVNLAQKGGISNLLKLYDRAAKGVYHPRSYTEEDDLRGILLWKLGGVRVAGIGQRALGLPSISTLRRRTLIKPLIVSSGSPKVSEIQENIKNSFAPVANEMKGGFTDGIEVPHQVVMFDELKVETRARICPLTNKILGPCREHVGNTSVEFVSEKEVHLLLEALDRGDVHMAVDGTVGGIGLLSGDTRLYGARGVLISGDCKRESGTEHVVLINTMCVASKQTGARTISIASDGESRRGEAFVQYTFKHTLSAESPIYDHLAPLVMMDLRTGDDDLTCDKDAKHVFKRLRNLCIREKGSIIYGVHITPAIIRAHLHSNKVTTERSGYLLNPKDKQDVKLAYDLLHEIWTLPPPPPTSSPGFQSTRKSLIMLGSLYRHLLLPYICIDLSLSEQLTHLSSAAHLLMALFADNKATTKMMPTQLYVDIMIMVKNVYFCVAKAKVDNPNSKFWIILLGTDRLETLFGILRTMIGNDSNLDLLQLGLRLANTSEVATILAKYPHWDRAPRRLRLPTLSKEGFEIHKDVDHIGPSSWRGDVRVSEVVLQTCWKLGRTNVEEEFTEIRPILDSVCLPSRTIFSPLGKDLVNSPNEDDNVDDTQDMDQEEAPRDVERAPLGTELEDEVAEESPEDVATKYRPYFELDGIKISKAKFLKQSFERYQRTGSTDRLRRVADGERYFSASSRSTDILSDIITDDPLLSHRTVTNDTPIASLLKCSGHYFLCIGEINNIFVDAESVDAIPIDYLEEKSVNISYQLLHFIPATGDDDPEAKHDWRWSFRRLSTFKVPGILVQPINPDVCTRIPNKPYYLCESGSLLATGASLLERVATAGNITIPEIKKSPEFPYCEASGKVCFLCENDEAERNVAVTDQCPMCDPPVALDRKKGQRVLEHMAAHILFDPKIDRSILPCGLCLRPSPACTFYLKKTKGAKTVQVDEQKSTCANFVSYNYATAEVSSNSSPASNVPMRCPLCVSSAPAIWRYNLEHHIRIMHKAASPSAHEDLWKLGGEEIMKLKEVWEKRHKGKKVRAGKGPTEFQVSEAHSSRMAGRYVFDKMIYYSLMSIIHLGKLLNMTTMMTTILFHPSRP
ncbi:hypothetical protein BJ912DRAFT_857405 [Pholiota molesta]|nr:hypothetical protein BJ912DRAFT_857405 [Pholiota molesta]